MKSIESSGKTVKDAINQGAKELGCDPSDLEIEVLEMGSPGLFGMFGRLARVKLTLKEAGDEFEIDIPEMTIDQPAQKAARSRRREEKPKAKSAPAPQEAASYAMLREQIREVLHTLTPREEHVLKLRYGLNDGRTHTLEEVGKEFNITRERIRQIEAKALRKLRHPSRSKRLKDFLD